MDSIQVLNQLDTGIGIFIKFLMWPNMQIKLKTLLQTTRLAFIKRIYIPPTGSSYQSNKALAPHSRPMSSSGKIRICK